MPPFGGGSVDDSPAPIPRCVTGSWAVLPARPVRWGGVDCEDPPRGAPDGRSTTLRRRPDGRRLRASLVPSVWHVRPTAADALQPRARPNGRPRPTGHGRVPAGQAA